MNIEDNPYIKSTINKMIFDRELSRELYQELCLKLLEKKKFINNREWIKVVVNNFVIDYYRSINKKSRIIIEREVEDWDLISEVEEKDYTKLYDCIDELSYDLKESLILKYFTNMKYDEISKLLKIKKQTIVSRVFRAVKQLKVKIKNDTDLHY